MSAEPIFAVLSHEHFNSFQYRRSQAAAYELWSFNAATISADYFLGLMTSFDVQALLSNLCNLSVTIDKLPLFILLS